MLRLAPSATAAIADKTGLLPLLKSIQKTTHIREWAGKTVGVDAYSWLHKGTIPCAIELALGTPSSKYGPRRCRRPPLTRRRYVDYAMHRVRMLRHFGVTPYLVFDGDYLPSKAATEIERERWVSLPTRRSPLTAAQEAGAESKGWARNVQSRKTHASLY